MRHAAKDNRRFTRFGDLPANATTEELGRAADHNARLLMGHARYEQLTIKPPFTVRLNRALLSLLNAELTPIVAGARLGLIDSGRRQGAGAPAEANADDPDHPALGNTGFSCKELSNPRSEDRSE